MWATAGTGQDQPRLGGADPSTGDRPRPTTKTEFSTTRCRMQILRGAPSTPTRCSTRTTRRSKGCHQKRSPGISFHVADLRFFTSGTHFPQRNDVVRCLHHHWRGVPGGHLLRAGSDSASRLCETGWSGRAPVNTSAPHSTFASVHRSHRCCAVLEGLQT